MRQTHYYPPLDIDSPQPSSPSLEKTVSPLSPWKQLVGALAQWGKSLLSFYTGSSDLRISRRFNRQGYPYFHIYDPIKNTHHTFLSEDAVLVWLEQRYHQ